MFENRFYCRKILQITSSFDVKENKTKAKTANLNVHKLALKCSIYLALEFNYMPQYWQGNPQAYFNPPLLPPPNDIRYLN